MTAAETVVVTVPGCHLCAEALAVVASVCAERGSPWREQDLFALDDEAVRRWRDWVPVVLVGDTVVDMLQVSAERLRTALGAPARG